MTITTTGPFRDSRSVTFVAVYRPGENSSRGRAPADLFGLIDAASNAGGEFWAMAQTLIATNDRTDRILICLRYHAGTEAQEKRNWLMIDA